MGSKKSINQRIDQHMLDNPKRKSEVGYYQKVADQFGANPEKVRKRWRMLQKRHGLNELENILPDITPTTLAENTSSISWSNTGDSTLDAIVDEKIETVEDLMRVCNIDANKFEVTHFQIKSYGGKFSVKASLKAKKIDGSRDMQAQLLLDQIKKYSPKFKKDATFVDVDTFVGIDVSETPVRDCALEINIPDLHIGKLGWAPETGQEYNTEIAIARYKQAVKNLISRVNPLTLEKIILPIGNDMINVDNRANTTTGGTPQSSDSRFGRMFQAAKTLLIETIDYLSQLAPVEVVVIPGNHDAVAMFTLGEVIDAWYHNNDQVSVSNTHFPRKYVMYGQNLVMYVHGHNEKHQDLGIICATEQPQLWAATKFRRVHIGHLHHSKQIKFTDVKEYPGFTIKVLNSLSANDAWHAEKGYNSLKGAEAFLYHRENGLLANYYYLNVN